MGKHVSLDGRLHCREGLGMVHHNFDANQAAAVSQKKNGRLKQVLMAYLT